MVCVAGNETGAIPIHASAGAHPWDTGYYGCQRLCYREA